MPLNEEFSMEILVGNQAIPEYVKNSMVYVESNLYTPVSYHKEMREMVKGEVEIQKVPVTPYTVKVEASSGRSRESTPHYFRVMVDGVKVKGVSLSPGQSKIIKGFRDGNKVKELLFSLPKSSKTADEKMDSERMAHVGKIEVECWQARLLDHTYELRHKSLQFQQASKSDSVTVTQGLYTMATSAVGENVCERSMYRKVDQWKRVKLLSKLTVQYHMGHTLTAMGIRLIPYPIGQKSRSTGSGGQAGDNAGNEAPSTSGSSSVNSGQNAKNKRLSDSSVIDLRDDNDEKKDSKKIKVDLKDGKSQENGDNCDGDVEILVVKNEKKEIKDEDCVDLTDM